GRTAARGGGREVESGRAGPPRGGTLRVRRRDRPGDRPDRAPGPRPRTGGAAARAVAAAPRRGADRRRGSPLGNTLAGDRLDRGAPRPRAGRRRTPDRRTGGAAHHG